MSVIFSFWQKGFSRHSLCIGLRKYLRCSTYFLTNAQHGRISPVTCRHVPWLTTHCLPSVKSAAWFCIAHTYGERKHSKAIHGYFLCLEWLKGPQKLVDSPKFLFSPIFNNVPCTYVRCRPCSFLILRRNWSSRKFTKLLTTYLSCHLIISVKGRWSTDDGLAVQTDPRLRVERLVVVREQEYCRMELSGDYLNRG